MKNPKESTGRLAVVLSHPTQYYSPWFRWIRAHTGIEFRVFYLWDFGVTRQRDPNFETSFKWDVDLLSGYDHEFIQNVSKRPGAEHFFGYKNPGLTRRLSEWRPDVVLLFGYKWYSHMRVIFWASLHGVPIVFRGDSHLLGRGAPALHVRLALRVLFTRFASVLCVGAANREYFQALGVPSKKLFHAPHSVNAELFDRHDAEHQRASEELRSRIGVEPGALIVLFAGKLVPAKQPAELLQAFSRLNPAGAALVIVGDGPEKERLQSLASRHSAGPSASQIILLPFSNQSEMPARYLMSDLFVLPSRGSYETWGLAVNEAMHMGVPCIVSERVGCQRDLVTHGVTGWVFDSEDPAALERALSQALEALASPTRREQILQAVEGRISNFTYAQTTGGLVAALGSIGERT